MKRRARGPRELVTVEPGWRGRHWITRRGRHRIARREGRTVVELIVALPILALGGAAVTGLLLTAGGFLHEGERRLNLAIVGSVLLDSLAAVDRAAGAPEAGSGVVRILDRTLSWEWDGDGRLTLTSESPDDPAGPAWVLERRGPRQPVWRGGEGGPNETSP